MALTLTTYLQAVNMVLSAAGEMPVDNYTSAYGADAVLADQILTETTKKVQAEGWYFNTRKGPITLTAVTNQFPVGTALRIEFYNYDDIEAYGIRNGYLWDLRNNTDTFTTISKLSVKRIVDLLEWTDLPEAARQYIAKKAARIFVDRHVSDPSVAKMARQDEQEALMLMSREDINSANARIYGPKLSPIVDMYSALDVVQGLR